MRIGFIAMSGVRAHDPELNAIGLTLPGFVERRQVIASMPSLSLLTLAALTPRDVEVEYHEIRDLREQPDLLSPVSLADLIGGSNVNSLDLGNNARCPGALERDPGDGSTPFTDGGAVNCDTSQVPVGP